MQTLKPKKQDLNRPEIVRNPGLRRKVWERDQGICAKCGRFDRKWIHDHRNPLWRKGPDTLENSWTLCRHCEKPKTSSEANARLIAAATDLYEALTELLKHAGIADADPSDIDGEDHDRESKARAALSKAVA